ncbi:MAG: VCBS repeat-containing protein [Desulfuromonadaceae bacterium]
MRIDGAQIQLGAKHEQGQEQQVRESLQYWKGERRVELQSSDTRAQSERQIRGVAADISAQTRKLQARRAAVPVEAGEALEPIHDLRINLFKRLVESLTGRKIKVLTPADIQANPPAHKEVKAEPAPSSQTQSSGWGLAYDYYESHYEYESTSFSAQGVVKTADGKEIAIDLELNMQREFFQSQSFSLRAGAALKDPLVVNFAGTSAELTQQKFSFDIDMDGREDQISFVRPGSGFLVLDRNADGEVNDGSELFGPATGNGFTELAEHDEDQNGWIDEADSVFDRLRVWSKDAAGEDHLMALGQSGIGALYLGHIETPFLLKDDANQDLGQVRSSGIALHEDGRASVLQQVDLVV